MRLSILPAVSALSLALSAASPAQAQQAQAELQIDVATHAMPGAPGLGALGRVAGAMSGGNTRYGMARHPGMPGKYLDVALHNRRQPGTPASQAVPRGLGVGDRIELLPQPAAQDRDANAGVDTASMPQADGAYTIRYYWGCGDQVRAGQPAEFRVTVRNGKPTINGRAMTPREVPQSAIEPDARHALWPNPSARRSVGGKATLAGNHALTGEALPAGLQFELGRDHDFLPGLSLRSEGDPAQGPTLRWDAVDGARAYFIHGTAMDGETIVMWSSAQDSYAGPELIDFLPENLVAQWTGKRTLMGANALDCRIPAGVFASAPMLQMIAYGNDRTISQSGLSVRVRSKSTAMLMPGFGAGADPAREAARPAARDAAKGLLRGLLGN